MKQKRYADERITHALRQAEAGLDSKLLRDSRQGWCRLHSRAPGLCGEIRTRTVRPDIAHL